MAFRFRDSVLATQPAHPHVTIEETGDISASDARDHAVNRDLYRAELLSVTVTSGGAEGLAGSVELPLVAAGDNSASRHTITVLRRDLVPRTLGRIPGVETAVTGVTAEDVDFTGQMKHGLP